MGYRKYGEAEYEKLKKQHNIMALVGNGFDIQIMHDFAQPSDTRYETFYHYLKFRSFDEENVIVKQMEALLEAGNEELERSRRSDPRGPDQRRVGSR